MLTRLGNFVEFTGFGNGKGHVSFNKLCTWTALQAFVFCLVTKRDPSWALLSFGVVVIGAGFGLKGYLGAIKQNTLNASHTAQTSVSLTGDLAAIAREVQARRDPKAGIDPA
jgi:hypothetical protein